MIPQKKTVRNDIFSSAMLFSVIIMSVFGVLFSLLLYQINTSKAIDIVKQRNYAVNYYIDGYFAEINNTIEVLSVNPSVQRYPSLDSDSRDDVLKLFRTYTDINKNISYIYSAYETGELVINDYIPPADYDPRVRPWYVSAINSKPRLSTGIPYRDIITEEWLLSTSKVLYGEKGELTGVVSCDSSIEMVTDILQNQRDEIYRTSYSYVTTLDGEIILHHNKSLLTKSLSELTGTQGNWSEREGLFRYRLGLSDKIAYFSRCQEADWLVVTVVEDREIRRPIFRTITFSLILAGLIALAVGIAQSLLLGKRFSMPVLELQKEIKALVEGSWQTNRQYKYPDNELGFIAEEISRLAGTELYRKSNELERVNRELRERNSELLKVSVSDQLTGLYNRRKMDEEIKKSINTSKRYCRSFSLIIFDVDHFKEINDVFGHQAGDDVLKELAVLIRDNIRPTDVACRWGGEEFLILCPETDLRQAEASGERLRSIVSSHRFNIDRIVTLSGGVGQYLGNEDFDKVLKRADDNLYKAKKEGRNRIIAR